MNFKNSKKQGDAGLGQAIAYFTGKGYDVALPLTDSADWDLIVEIDGELKRVQVKTSTSPEKEKFALRVMGGNKSGTKTPKYPSDQNWDLLFVHHLRTGRMAIFPKDVVKNFRSNISLCDKNEQYLI